MIARFTGGFTGADLENLTNEAALLAARKNRKADVYKRQVPDRPHFSAFPEESHGQLPPRRSTRYSVLFYARPSPCRLLSIGIL